MKHHPHVPHPMDRFKNDEGDSLNDRILMFLGERVLASSITFYLSLIVPLVTLPMSNTVKLIVSIIASSWFQCWALPALQRSQMKSDAKRDAKYDADHETLTYLAGTLDRVEALLTGIKEGKIT